MSKNFKLVHLDGQGSSSSCTAKTDWKLCIICQEDKAEASRCPLRSKRTDKGSGYSSLAEHLIQFNELGQLPSTLPLERLDEGQGIEAAMIVKKAQYHNKCKLKYNITKLPRAQKQTLGSHDQQTEY